MLDEADHMADLGFLPAVRRLLDQTPRDSQRLLFSATLDKAIDVLVKRFLHSPVTHQADSAQSPISTMDHHVLHIGREHRVAGPGRPRQRPRPHRRLHPHQARREGADPPAQPSGVPTVELHGNLSQNARTRNMEAFHAGKAATLVATDIAARGIHVDDVALVIHADPPVEHKAYLHRSGRTARAGAAGTVITLMTDEQVRDVRQLTRAAGIKPTTTKIDGSHHPVLAQLAPGKRITVPGGLVVEAPADDRPSSRRPAPVAAAQPLASRSRRPGRHGGSGQRHRPGRQAQRLRRRQPQPVPWPLRRGQGRRRRAGNHSAAVLQLRPPLTHAPAP